jgi:hypothetical protein
MQIIGSTFHVSDYAMATRSEKQKSFLSLSLALLISNKIFKIFCVFNYARYFSVSHESCDGFSDRPANEHAVPFVTKTETVSVK